MLISVPTTSKGTVSAYPGPQFPHHTPAMIIWKGAVFWVFFYLKDADFPDKEPES